MDSSNLSLTLSDGSRLRLLDKTPQLFIDQTIAIYGRRKSGKSTMIDDIMFYLRHDIATVFIVSQTASSTNPYEGKVPKCCVKTNASKEWLENLVSNQKKRALVFHTANNEKVLSSLFKKIQSTTSSAMQKNIVLKANQKLQTLEHSNLQYAQKKTQKQEIRKMMKKAILTLYRKEISNYSQELLRRSDLSIKERIAVQYLNFNPRVLLVFDDCASMFKKWCHESPQINEIFYNGRWLLFTVIISTQTDKVVATELRGNAMISIFTNKEAAITNFNRTSNGYTKEDRQRAALCVEAVFGGSPDENHKKLVFMPFEDGELFRYTIADIHDDFQMCSPIVWELEQNNDGSQDQEAVLSSFLGK